MSRAAGPGRWCRTGCKGFTIAPQTAIVDFLVQLNAAIQPDVGYSVRMEPGVQTPDYTLSSAIGSCRDSAWLLVSLLRELGLAARFVSGYLVQLTSDIASLDGPSGPTADFTDLHAWAEVYIPGAGWIGMDPTSGLFAGEGHIPLSATPHPSTAAAITGSTGSRHTTLEYSNVVRRIHEDPRVTLPYTPEQWAGSMLEVGALVDKRLAAGDVRLTMGGEPTFVSIDDGTSAEWTIDADGPKKRERAGVLAERLRRIYAPKGCRAPRAGQVVPGRAVAALADRHALAVRRGAAVDRSGTAGRSLGRRAESDAGHRRRSETRKPDQDVARRFVTAVAEYFELPASQVRPAFEDALGKLAQQVRMPAGEPVEPPDLDEDSAGRTHRAVARARRVGHRGQRLRVAAAPARRRSPTDTDDTPTSATTRPPGRRRRASAGGAPTGGCAAGGSCC